MSVSSDLGTACSDGAREFPAADGPCDDGRRYRRDHTDLVVPAGTLRGLVSRQEAGSARTTITKNSAAWRLLTDLRTDGTPPARSGNAQELS